jgi:Squalene-hopene cyclase C-terminal domain/Prenyltransferase and squalene oxidase repeat
MAFVVAAVIAATPQQFLLAHQQPNGAFAESGGKPDAALTAWAVLGLRATRTTVDDRYLRTHEDELQTPTEIALGVLAQLSPSDALVARLDRVPTNVTVNATAWKVLALRRVGRPIPRNVIRFLTARQTKTGGWSWALHGAPDSNDTAAVVQALRAARVRGVVITRALRFLRRLQNRDGGFELTAGRGSDTQSTAWAVQAFVAAGSNPGAAARRYLLRLRRPDGSYRYSARYAVTPVWVTAQVLPALAGRPYPLP